MDENQAAMAVEHDLATLDLILILSIFSQSQQAMEWFLKRTF